VNLWSSRACALALALGSATASCTFAPTGGGAGGPDGSIEPRPDADPLAPDARPSDAGVIPPDATAPPDAFARCQEWTPRPTHFDPCALPPPSPALTLEQAGTYLYDTDQGTLADPDGNEIAHASVELPGNPAVRAISVESLLVGNVARLRAVGTRPLLVASWNGITVQGTIDVSSNSQSGAGANTGQCEAAGEGTQGDNGGGGGGGGGFGGRGGNGGNGEGGGNRGERGDSVGTPDTVRGGCPGARGGIGDGDDGGGAGGAGGGALQLTALVRIDIQGVLHAGGAGGQGGRCGDGRTRSGAGGGGSGGLIDLEAPMIAFGSNAVVAANGGGGGEGCQGSDSDSGEAGQASDQRAQGATGTSASGGDGGDGSAGTSRDGTDGGNGTSVVLDRGSGGGGGGGAGYIILDGNDNVAGGAVLSPPQTDR
jgi:hypothetical protein